jgi:hypothetical protein
VARSAPDVGAEIRRRLDHLLACEKLQQAGFAFDLAEVFADAPVPDPAQVQHDLDEFRRILHADHGWNGNTDDLQRIGDLIAGMSDAGKEAFVAALTADDLAGWNRMADSDDGLFSDNGLTHDQVLRLGDDLLPALSDAQVRKLAAGLPVLEPGFTNIEMGGGGSWTWWPGSLDDDPPDLSGIHQGNAGDCWFVSALAAEVQQNPHFVQDHLVDNGNGTYTVTFYRDGKPVPVTVDGTLPTTEDGHGRFVHAQPDWEAGGALWAAIYEKAYARFHDSYGEIEGGWGDVALGELTGRPTHRSDPGEVSLDDVRATLDAGLPVTVGTKNDKFLGIFGGNELVDDQKLVANHEYRVKQVTQTPDGHWTVVLVNPWGPTAAAPYEVELTEDEYRDWIGEVAWRD